MVYVALYKTGEIKLFNSWDEASPHIIGVKGVIAHKKFQDGNDYALKKWVENVQSLHPGIKFGVTHNSVPKQQTKKEKPIDYNHVVTPITIGEAPILEIYCDGGAIAEGQDVYVGAWSFCYDYKGEIKAYSGVGLNITNYKAELLGLKAVLSHLYYEGVTTQNIKIYCDNKAVVQGYMEWLDGWISSGRIRKIQHNKVWEEIKFLKDKFPNLKVEHIYGHKGVRLNEVADRICTLVMREFVNNNPELKRRYGNYVDRTQYKDINTGDKVDLNLILMDKSDVIPFDKKVGLEQYFQ